MEIKNKQNVLKFGDISLKVLSEERDLGIIIDKSGELNTQDETKPGTPSTITNNTSITSNSNPATPNVDLDFSSFMDKDDDDDQLFQFDMDSIVNNSTSYSTDINKTFNSHTYNPTSLHQPNNKRTKKVIGCKHNNLHLSGTIETRQDNNNKTTTNQQTTSNIQYQLLQHQLGSMMINPDQIIYNTLKNYSLLLYKHWKKHQSYLDTS
ncbi:hypothetical protein HELRODRAFT_174275 [Helobdella robusta]|uniref:Uncharacterized protein n=1 Tax=Helobdella robusta TaxID=6412 RepID=T1F7X4_HELRO|nr:hypothetical protein HELRODRAFT_174275 [Helobdella robusta]ESO02845.1 hypothetical protein HELRODRAFT_174275 [Helobdella robusta]